MKLAMVVTVMTLLLYTGGCAPVRPVPEASPSSLDLPADLEERLMALSPDSIEERDVAELLSRAPAPRIIALDGSLPIISMASFSRFLIRMGYLEESIRNPATGAYSYSSFESSAELAGMIAWYYENEGMMPVLIGHSQGGMLAIKVLYEFAGAFRERIPVWNPYRRESEVRDEIVDPLTGRRRPVVGLRAGFASAIATGKLMRYLLGQWDMVGRLRTIPDTVEEFIGFHIKNDLISGDLFRLGRIEEYRPAGSGRVRNVVLSDSGHMTVPLTEDLAGKPRIREWIDRYRPTAGTSTVPSELEAEGENIFFAAEIWHSIKRRWCIEAQRLVLAKRNMRQGQ